VAAGGFVVIFAGLALADHTCSPGNPDDCRNTAVVIGTAATLTAVLAISVGGLISWAKEWDPRRCAQTMRTLDSDLDTALAKSRTLLAQRTDYSKMWLSANPLIQDQIRAKAAQVDSQLEEMVGAVDDLYTRRQAVIEGCGEKLQGNWSRPKPAIGRDLEGHVWQVDSPLGAGNLTRPGVGGSEAVDPKDAQSEVNGRIHSPGLPEGIQRVVDWADPRVSSMKFTPNPEGGVSVDVTAQLGSGKASVSENGSVHLGVTDGRLTADANVPLKMMPFSGPLTNELNKAVDSFNRKLDEGGLKLNSISVGPDGRLHVSTGPK
jgi:hypothetical protein